MASTPDKKLIDCYWFLQDQCVKGDACEYRHSQKSRNTQTICKMWQQNQCFNRDCKFRHPSVTKAICIFFAQGKCTKGEACPFQHGGPSLIADTAIEQKKKEEEENLKKLQAERKKEEELLSQLKAQREQIEGKKQVPDRKAIMKVGTGGTFGRTVGDIVKDAQNSVKSQQKAEKVTLVSIVKKNRAQDIQVKEPTPKNKKIKTQENEKKEPPGPISFGVKSLDQIIQEKGQTESDTTKVLPKQTTNSSAQSKDDKSYLEELRKKNQQKFRATPAQKSEPPAKSNPSPNSGTTNISPKRQIAEESDQKAEKRQKIDPDLKVPQQVEEKSSKSVDVPLDADTLELEELLED